MNSFVRLLQRLEALSASPPRGEASNAALQTALCDYLHAASADDAACTLRLLRGQAPKRLLPPEALRESACRHAGIEPWLFDACLQASGDWAETMAHLLPVPQSSAAPSLHEMLARLETIGHLSIGARADALLSCCAPWDAASRECALRIALGRWRRVVGEPLLQRALAAWSGVDVRRLQLCWAAVVGARESLDASRLSRLASEVVGETLPWPMAAIEARHDAPHDGPGECVVHAWHGARRVQLVRRAAGCWLWSDSGALLDAAWWLVGAERLPAGTVLQGEWLVGVPGQWADRGALERWLAALGKHSGQDTSPVFVVHDVLEAAGRDLRQLPYRERWALLASLPLGGAIARSPAVPVLDTRKLELRRCGFQGLLVMHLDAPHGAPGALQLWTAPRPTLRVVVQSVSWAAAADGRPGVELGVALWRARARGQRELPRLRDGHDVDALMALWAPIAKVWVDKDQAAALEPMAELTVQRFGPLRLLAPERVCEIAFEALLSNPRRRSGATLLEPQFLRWCEPAALADVDERDRLREWHSPDNERAP